MLALTKACLRQLRASLRVLGTSAWLIAALPALINLSACATDAAQRNHRTIALADSDAPIPARMSEAAVRSLSVNLESDPDTVKRYLSDISSVSDLPIYKGNRVELLIDGPATYKSMFAAIESAEHYIYLETYIFADDKEGRKFADLLEKKCRQGIQVKVVYDSIGSVMTGDGIFERMKNSGVSIIEFNAVNPVDGGNPLKLNNRNHRKLLIVDGKVAYTGGINLSSVYASGSGGAAKREPTIEGWRDTQIAVTGPAVDGFAQLFVENWESLDGEMEGMPAANPDGDASGQEIVAIVNATGGDAEESEIFAAYVDAIRYARRSVWITQAYFAPAERFMAVLEQAARRGVDVRLLVPGVSDSWLVLNASRSRYERLLRAGVRIYENRQAVLHAKTAVIDSLWSTVGSSNLDYRSFLHNDEVNAIILGADFAAEMESQFQRDIGQATEITLDSWNERAWWDRLSEGFSWVWEYWL